VASTGTRCRRTSGKPSSMIWCMRIAHARPGELREPRSPKNAISPMN
jgi:hypothetical protein